MKEGHHSFPKLLAT